MPRHPALRHRRRCLFFCGSGIGEVARIASGVAAISGCLHCENVRGAFCCHRSYFEEQSWSWSHFLHHMVREGSVATRGRGQESYNGGEGHQREEEHLRDETARRWQTLSGCRKPWALRPGPGSTLSFRTRYGRSHPLKLV